MVDLHTHSTASDGTFTPEELAAAVKKAGISAFALTDHDILSGLDEAAAEAKRQGIIFIRGVEISVKWSPGELHLLGLDLRKDSRELNMLLQDLQDERINRNQRMAEKLKKAGFDISYEKAKKVLPENRIFRGIIATGDIFVAKKEIKNKIKQNFNSLCCEMESCSIIHTCHLNGVKYLALRSISDNANEKADCDFETFVLESAKIVKSIILDIIEEI